ncbi:hypothetical protein JTL99_34710, partial [Pseudomonas aeruginosa]|nr:hypothetical protein [Pseudomonas aeruginosa]
RFQLLMQRFQIVDIVAFTLAFAELGQLTLSVLLLAQALFKLVEAAAQPLRLLGLVALDHPLIRHAVARAAARGVRVFTLLSELSVPQRSGYIGLDNHKAGRTAAWF